MGDDNNEENSKKIYEPDEKSFKPQPALGINTVLKNADVYYGIFIADNLKKQEDIKLIFSDKTECLNSLKRIPGARFKAFSTWIEAKGFVEYGPIICCPTPDGQSENKNFALVGEKPSPFRGPKSQDLVKFRKAIEKGNVDYFEECVSKNPRYLVSSGDTPSVLQEGSRYNALHIACRNNQPYLCQRVLSIVSNEDFFQKLYPDDLFESSIRRSQFLLDLYLNTPDKALNETPLHFACKLGAVGCVKILVSYIACDKNRINKHNEKPIEIICNRVPNQNKNLIQQIKDLLGDLYYIPLLRDEDNCLPPQIGTPYSPIRSSSLSNSPIGSPVGSSSPVSPSLMVKGYAGPMSPQRAETFYSRWKRSAISSPARNLQDKQSLIRLTDHEKGLERVGRDLASELSVDWREYWDFLGTFTKLNSEDGLQKLENHLQNQYKKVVQERNFAEMSHTMSSLDRNLRRRTSEDLNLTDSLSLIDSSINQLDMTQFSSASIGEICRGLEALRLNMSLSPNPKASSFVSNVSHVDLPDNTFNNASYICDYINSNSFNESLGIMDNYNFIIQSLSISTEKLLSILREATDCLELHVGQNFNVTLLLKTKIRKEIINLRKIIVNHLESQGTDKKYDLSFVHLLLAANVSILLPESLTSDKIHLLLLTISALRKNIQFFEGSSSDEDDTYHETIHDVDSTLELDCFVKAFEKSLAIINCLVKKGEEGTLNKADLGICECLWNPIGGGTVKILSPGNNNLSSSFNSSNCKPSYKYSHAHSFLRKILFTDQSEKKTVAKQLIFKDEEVLTQSNISEAQEDPSRSDDEDAESFVSAVSSVDEAGMVTPEEAINVYINGVEPSKVDVDVLLAIDEVDVDPEKFPYTSMWQKLVSSHPNKIRDSWTSPWCCRKMITSSRSALIDGNITPKRLRNNSFGNLGESPLL